METKETKLQHRILRMREARGWTQTELAERAGTTQQSIARYEGGRDPKASQVVSLAAAFGVTVSYLLGLDDELVEMNLSPDELRLIQAYRAAGGETRDVMLGIAENVLSRVESNA